MKHPGGCLDSLAATVLAALHRFGSDASNRVLPPLLTASRFAVGNLANNDTQDCIGKSSEDETANDDCNGDDGTSEEALNAVDGFIVGGDE